MVVHAHVIEEDPTVQKVRDQRTGFVQPLPPITAISNEELVASFNGYVRAIQPRTTRRPLKPQALPRWRRPAPISMKKARDQKAGS